MGVLSRPATRGLWRGVGFVTFPNLELRLPAWIDDLCTPDQVITEQEDRVDLVLSLARANFELGNGGPFASAIFDGSNRLLGVGVNLVVPTSYAFAHAEIIAIGIAGLRSGNFTLVDHEAEMIASTEPCAMCLGAIPWSGVRRLVCSARDEDAARIGFEEGDKPSDWMAKLDARGIDVVRDFRRERGALVLADYAGAGGVIYNGTGR